MRLVFRSKEDLRAFLRLLIVPPHDERSQAEKDSKEFWCLIRYLLALADTPWLVFPLTVDKIESPDFLVQMRGVKIGIECSEVTENEYQKESLEDQRTFFDYENGALPYYGTRERMLSRLRNILHKKIRKLDSYRAENRDVREHILLLYVNMESGLPTHPEAKEFYLEETLKELNLLDYGGFDSVSVILGESLIHDVNSDESTALPLALG